MSDWQIGDLALCVDNARVWADPEYDAAIMRLKVGQVYHVVGLRTDHPFGLGLWLHGVSSAYGDSRAWLASRFRKIRPDKPEACEEEFVTLLKRAKVKA